MLVRPKRTNRYMPTAARAIASVVTTDELSAEYIIPSVFDRRVAVVVAKAVARAAIRTGVARRVRKSSAAIVGDLG